MIDHRFNFEIANTAATNPGMKPPKVRTTAPAVTFGYAPHATTTSIAPCANVSLQFLGSWGWTLNVRKGNGGDGGFW